MGRSLGGRLPVNPGDFRKNSSLYFRKIGGWRDRITGKTVFLSRVATAEELERVLGRSIKSKGLQGAERTRKHSYGYDRQISSLLPSLTRAEGISVKNLKEGIRR